MLPKKIGVIVTTYNQPEWLRKVLLGFERQSEKQFTLVIADDGSSLVTEEVIEEFINNGKLDIQHIWHDDKGFRKCQILNKAIVQTDCDYLIFTDGDCIPEPDFVRKHKSLARPNQFLSGGYVKLTMQVSKSIQERDIFDTSIFNLNWLKQRGQPSSSKLWKLIKNKSLTSMLNLITPTKSTWNGMNSSGWKKDIIACNGFNEDMQYGGLDRELGERLKNYGIKGKQVRYSISCLHLDHPRSYDTPETWKKNYQIRNEVKRSRRYLAFNGIRKIHPAYELGLAFETDYIGTQGTETA